ncbi:hypothetical protein AN639_10935 [Candidatus Epulonipiscium fishelsonii]|uniref:Uncharacterized protein n=1 Tax=Candidatus Epulonipiscium fishelsonii TaxID=77094 RepID=A0ACC8XCQ6_9FIRM|nr:hypothetical protein AN396_05760 [Epulopiscium sp. SCG-B11WGA-EpuloA1]ONI43188.1 hypothetical protein AN639_10935 [Epulopiscium sp. SCG-B05WGA-EpuloA1]
MKIVETPWNVAYKFLLFIFGMPFFSVGLIMLIIFEESEALILNGVLWIVLAVGFKIKNIYNERELERFKKEDLCYEGTMINIIPSHWVRIGNYITACVECSYKTDKGDCVVKSGYYLLSPFDTKENLCPKIYVNRDNFDESIVELFRRDN